MDPTFQTLGTPPAFPAQYNSFKAPQVVCDSSGQYMFDPSSWGHSYAYDANNNLQTDTITNGVLTFVKTYAWVNSNNSWLCETESAWVLQS